MMRTRHLTVLLAGLVLATTPAVRALSPNELGAFLAGRQLPPTSPLAGLQDSAAYREHAAAYAAQWYRYRDYYFAPMRAWSAAELMPRIGAPRQVTYLFAGPDLVSALALFPQAGSYVLGGLEPVGKLTDPRSLSPEELAVSLAMLRKSTEVIMSFSHFITKDMKAELAASHFQGVFPIMLVFLSFTDARIERAERLTLRRDGTLQPGEQAGGQAALRLVFSAHPGAPPSEVVYMQANIANDALNSNPAFLEWLAARGPATGYLKAASYLMHEGSFSRVRDFLIDHCQVILQDDSGIPMSALKARDWKLIFFGNYTTPLDIFTKYDQPSLRAVYQGGGAFPLPFGFGYRWQKGSSTLMLAMPPDFAPRALPVPVIR